MNTDMVIKAMDRIEALLAAAEGLLEVEDPALHAINNARQIASAVKILVEVE